MTFKRAKVGLYGEKTRALQRRLSYERVSQTWKIANVFLYLGSRANDDPSIKDVQITTFMETPDRAYSKDSIPINIHFEELHEQIVDYTQFGVIDPTGVDQVVRVHINSYESLGRPIVEGDVLEIPFFEQDSHKAYWEVTDVDRSQEFEKFYAVVKLAELTDSRETREIDHTGSIGPALDSIMDQHLDFAEEMIPFNGYDDSDLVNGEAVDQKQEWDGRQKNQASFLDDFDGEL